VDTVVSKCLYTSAPLRERSSRSISTLCQSCQFTTTIAELTVPGHRDDRYKLEYALTYLLNNLKRNALETLDSGLLGH
jgi:hypothetical protein